MPDMRSRVACGTVGTWISEGDGQASAIMSETIVHVESVW